MVNPNLKPLRPELSARLQTLMFLRVLFVSFLLGASIFIQVKETQTYFAYIQTAHFFLLATIYFLTFIYVILLKYSKNLLWFAYFQLLVDTLFVTAIIYTTGGIDSVFSFLYILTIINGSIILYRKGGMLIASSCSILYGLLLDLHYYNVIHPLGIRGPHTTEHEAIHLFYLIFVNITGFYLAAYLSSYLSEQTRKSRFELKEKQIDIDKLEILNKSIIESITSGLIALDGQNKIIFFNPAAEKIFETKAYNVSGQRIEDEFPFLSGFLPEGVSTSTEMSEKIPPFVDLPYLKPNGDKIHLRLSISPLRFPSGYKDGSILVFQDVTEIKKIEAEMKKVEGLAIIGELAAGVAHEIRNPMASISGSIQMLAEGLEKDNVNRQLMDIVSREINRLNNLVNDFLLFARPKKANWQKFDLNQLILESLELFQNSQHWTEKTKLVTDFRQDIKIESDPEQIKQVLWNLFINARDAMPDGGSLYVITELNSNETHKGHKMVKIIVRDTGEGFDDRALSQLFIPFFTTKEGGSGLGLATVKRVVEGLHGKVNGGNHPERGAHITILLPESHT